MLRGRIPVTPDRTSVDQALRRQKRRLDRLFATDLVHNSVGVTAPSETPCVIVSSDSSENFVTKRRRFNEQPIHTMGRPPDV